jgi:uncharacterized protein (TIGR01244 family)
MSLIPPRLVLGIAATAIVLAGSSLAIAAESGAPATTSTPSVEKVNKSAEAAGRFDRTRFDEVVTKRKHLVPNFHQVHPFLYRSGEPTAAGVDEIKSKGIETIIDLRAETDKSRAEKEQAEKLGMKYIQLPMSSEPPTKTQVETFMKEVRAARDKKSGPVLVHCAHGSDRTGCMVGIWRVTEDGYDYDQAYKEMRHYWFTPKFTKLSGAVKQHANKAAKK